MVGIPEPAAALTACTALLMTRRSEGWISLKPMWSTYDLVVHMRLAGEWLSAALVPIVGVTLIAGSLQAQLQFGRK